MFKAYRFKIKLDLCHGKYVYKSMYFIRDLLSECSVLGIKILKWSGVANKYKVTIKLECTSEKLGILFNRLVDSYPDLEVIKITKCRRQL